MLSAFNHADFKPLELSETVFVAHQKTTKVSNASDW